MYSKLALRNVRKCFRDYSIYFFTLMFGVCIFYIFNSIESQQSMMILSDKTMESMNTLQMIINHISVFVSVILGFLIVYANRFLVRRRKKELAIYQLLGMEKGQISKILLIETLLVAIFSLAVGLGLGVLISQGFAVLTASLFEVKLAEFKFIFSSAAAAKAIIYFGISFILVMLFNRIEISKQKLIDLLYAERKNEKFKSLHLILSVFIFIVSIACLSTAYYLVDKTGIYLDNRSMITAVILGGLGTLLFFFSISGFLLKIIQQNKTVYLKNLNMFVLKQINNKINTAYLSITMVCLMLFLSICALASGMGLSKSIQGDLEYLHPYDASESVFLWDKVYNETNDNYDYNYIEIDITEQLNKTSVPIGSYAKETAEVTLRDLTVDREITQGYFNGDYMCLTDYNKLLKMQGKEPMTLNDDEFIFNCIIEEHRRDYQNYYKNNTMPILGQDMKLKSVDETVLFNNAAMGNYACIHIMTDKMLEDIEIFQHTIVINYIKSEHKYNDLYTQARDEVINNLRNEYTNRTENLTIYTNTTKKIDDFEDSKSTAVTVSYLAVYLGLVFSVVSAVVLAITQLSEATDNHQRYNLLRKLGTDEKMINKALLTQIGIYFGVPLLLAIVHSIFGIRFANTLISNIGKSNILRDSIITAIILIIIYGGYFLATYLGSKRIISK